MKFLLLFMFVVVALADQESENDQDLVAEFFYQIFQMDPMDSLECVHKSKATMEDIRYMEHLIENNKSEPLEETPEFKSLKEARCTMVSCAQKKGLIVGGVVQVEELFKLFQNIGIREDMLSQMRNIVRICKEQQVTDTSDECMTSYLYMKCVFNTRIFP